MEKKTYLQESVKNGMLVRWNDWMMPLKVYIAPMKFYSKKGESEKFRGFVKRALEEWTKVSHGKVSFVVVDGLFESNINIDWQRVQRKALGLCNFSYDKQNRLAAAEVMIGLTEGLVHADYNDDGEIYHTVLHEIGHAIGLGHSHSKSDIMYPIHQKNITKLGTGDILSVNWLYILEQGKSISDIANKYHVSGTDLDEIITKILSKQVKTEFEKVKDSIDIKPERNLLEEAENIANLKKYHMALQNIKIPKELTDNFRRQYRDSSIHKKDL